MLEDRKLIDMDIADTIIERPHGFKVNQRQFYLYPVTLGKTYLISRLVECLGINLEIIKANPYMEALRICQEKKESVCRILSYHTINKKEELFDYDFVQERCNFFYKEIDNDSMAQLLVMVLSEGDISAYIKHLGIDKEKRMASKSHESQEG